MPIDSLSLGSLYGRYRSFLAAELLVGSAERRCDLSFEVILAEDCEADSLRFLAASLL